MAKKIDEKALLSSLEFAAKAAEEFLRMYNQLKAEIEKVNVVKPLTPYQIKKKKHEEWTQKMKIDMQIRWDRQSERFQERVNEIMKANFLSYAEAINFIHAKNSATGKRGAAVRKKNAEIRKNAENKGLSKD